MKRRPPDFPQCYQDRLRAYLEQGRHARLETALGLGDLALAAGMPVLELAKLHERTLVLDLLPACPARKRAALTKRAGEFFAAAIAHEPKAAPDAREALRLKKVIGTLSVRTVGLATANQQLCEEIRHREEVEAALKTSERHLLKSLAKSDLLKEELRELSRQILSAQEEERKKISRELHDVIAQSLMGINVRLATLKREAGLNTRDLERRITLTQRLVTRSANIVHRFARELRPTELDDLGLIPALHSFMKHFTERTGVRTHLTTFAAVEKLQPVRRTVLYRVAQEALTNVARHARASRVDVSIRRDGKCVRLEVKDDGRSFQLQAIQQTRGRKRLGLLGMRERVEMIGGSFAVESSAGNGTAVIARIPVSKTTEKRWRQETGIPPSESP
jgi:signal transduction histidine kinase